MSKPSASARAVASRLVPHRFPWRAPTWPVTVPRPLPNRETGEQYRSDWTRRYPARLLRAAVLDNLTRPFVHLVAAPLVRGAEVLELIEAPVIVVANHASHLDTPLVLSVLPAHLRHRTVVAAAADHFFDRRWKAHLWSLALAAIPVERHRVSRRAAVLSADLIDEGWNLLIYPEGGRSPDGWMQEFRGGAAYLSTRTGRPVVPLHIDGTHRILPKGGRLRRGQATVTFGTPLWPEPGEDARRMGPRIEAAAGLLAAEARTDWWTARRSAATGGTRDASRGPDAPAWRRAWALDPARGTAQDAAGGGSGGARGAHGTRWARRR